APIFESSGGVTKVVVNADWVVLGGEAGAQFVALENKVMDNFNALKNAFMSWTPVLQDGGTALKVALTAWGIMSGTSTSPPSSPPTWPNAVGASTTKAK